MYERCDGASVTVFKFTINNLMRFILFNPDSEWFKACDPLTLESFGFELWALGSLRVQKKIESVEQIN